MTNEQRNWLITVGVLLIAVLIGTVMLESSLNPPVRVVTKEVIVTHTHAPTTTIVQVNVWCEYLETWILQDEVAAAENWINTQEPFDEVQNAMIEFARCSEFGKETARLLWPLWIGE